MKTQPLPSPERWPVLFRGGKLDRANKGDEAGEKILGAIDDAERLAKRGPVAMAHAKGGGKGYPTSLRGSEGGTADEHPDPVLTMVERGVRDPESEIAAALQLAMAGARLLRVARNTIDRLVPDVPEAVITPIGSRPVTASACIVCEEIPGRLVRGMCPDCRQDWISAGHPDVGLWAAQQRSAARPAVDPDDELARRREQRKTSRAAALRRLAG